MNIQPSRPTPTCSLIVGAFALAGLVTVHAAESTAEAEHLEQVIVTASKIDKPVNEITHSVSIVNESQIEQQGFTDVTEILRQLPGVEFKKVGGVGQFNYLKLRGLNASNVLVVVDGVTVNTASGGDTRNLLSQLNPDMIQSLELVRGPQATLYGANATAGVIVIQTKNGRHPAATLSAEAGSLKWRKYDGSLRNSVDVGAGSLAYSANVSSTDSDGIYQYEYFKDRSGQMKLDYTTDRWDVGVSHWSSYNDFGYAQLNEASATTKDKYWSFQTPDPNEHSKTSERISSVHANYHFTDQLQQKILVGSNATTYNIQDLANGILGYHLAPVTIPANSVGNSTAVTAGGVVTIRDTAGDVNAFYKDGRTQAEYNLIYTGTLLNLLGGFAYQKQNASQWGTYGAADTRDSQKSLFGSSDLKLLQDDLIVSLGVRADDYESWGRKTTGNAGAAWQISHAWNLYANYGTSFKPATMSQLFNPTYGYASLKPETGRTAEIGLRSELFDRNVKAELSYWNTHIDDVVFFDYSIVNPRRSSGFGRYNNGAEAKTSGAEFKLDYRLSSNVDLYGNYTYTDSQVRSVGGKWTRSVQIAYSKANAGVTYRVDSLTLGANLYYTGPRLRWAGDIETAGYVRMDVSARYQLNPRLSLSARIQNLLDRDYQEEIGYAESGLYAVFGVQYKFF